jgi:hypothetical protein
MTDILPEEKRGCRAGREIIPFASETGRFRVPVWSQTPGRYPFFPIFQTCSAGLKSRINCLKSVVSAFLINLSFS